MCTSPSFLFFLLSRSFCVLPFHQRQVGRRYYWERILWKIKYKANKRLRLGIYFFCQGRVYYWFIYKRSNKQSTYPFNERLGYSVPRILTSFLVSMVQAGRFCLFGKSSLVLPADAFTNHTEVYDFTYECHTKARARHKAHRKLLPQIASYYKLFNKS